jgi:hypothetical protein
MEEQEPQIPDGVLSCAVCRDGIDTVRAREELFMQKYGWHAHIVRDDDTCPFGYNFHTHGLDVSFDHLNFQACIPVDPEIPHAVISDLISMIKEGRIFIEGDVVRGLLKGGDGTYGITFKIVTSNGEDLLRIIFPDVNGSLDPKTMDHPWVHQWE